MKLLVMIFFLHKPLSILCPNIFLNTLFSNILNLFYFLNVGEHFLHPYKTVGKKYLQF